MLCIKKYERGPKSICCLTRRLYTRVDLKTFPVHTDTGWQPSEKSIEWQYASVGSVGTILPFEFVCVPILHFCSSARVLKLSEEMFCNKMLSSSDIEEV